MPRKKAQPQQRYEVIVQEGENDDVLIPIPPKVLEDLGWKEGDQIDFKLDDRGRIIFKRVEK